MKVEGHSTDHPSRPFEGVRAGFVVGPAFLLVAGWFLVGSDPVSIPLESSSRIHEDYLSTAPRRVALGDPPVLNLDGFDRTCSDCHKLFPARDIAPDRLLQHRHIRLDHGINNLCRNCHDTENRNRLVLHGGESIPYSRVVELCAKCHGPTYRDWEWGMHGRTNGYWDSSRGKPWRLSCIECHDPHTPRIPAMDPLVPLPPPNTLRMGEPGEHEHAAPPEEDPLRQAILQNEEAGVSTPVHKYGVIPHGPNKITTVYYMPLSNPESLDYSMSDRVCSPARRANEAILAEPIVE